jgi:general secretion pathway protein C
MLINIANLVFKIKWHIFINILLVALLSYSSVQLALLSMNNNTIPAINLNKTHAQFISTNQTNFTTLDMTPLLSAQLFGQQEITTYENPPTIQNVPKTQLNLTLHGIYHSSDPNASYAIIAIGKEDSQRYQLNQIISAGAVLHQIGRKDITLMRHGRYEKLYLVGEDKEDEQNTIVHLADHEIQVEHLLGHYQRELRKNPKNLASLANAEPVRNRHGQFVGFRLTPNQTNPQVFAHLNLKAGDIITAVNGIKLDSPYKGFSIMQDLVDAKQVNLTISRNGQTENLSFDIEP